MKKAALLCLGAAAGVLSAPGHAEITAQAGAGYTYDDNVFRQQKALSDLTGTPRSDRIYSINGEVDANITPADYQGSLQLNVGQNWYDRNTNLDNFNYAANVSLVRNSLDGIGVNVTGQSQRQLSSFADVRQPIRNIQELNRIDAEVTFPVTPEFRLVVDPNYTQNNSSAQVFKLNNFRKYGVRAGVGYYSPLGNSIALTVTRRYTDGLHDRPVTLGDASIVNGRINLVDTSIDLKLIYAFSPLTSVTAFASYVDRNDKSPLNSDYHGPAGYVTFTYAPRDTLQVVLTGGRRLESQSLLFVDAVRTDYVTLTADAQLADRFDLEFAGNAYRRRFQYNTTALVQRTQQVDRDLRLDAQLGYQLFDTVRLAIAASHEWRHSNIPFGNFHDTTVQLTASYAFGKATSYRNSRLFSGTRL